MNKKNKVKKRHKITGKLSEVIAEEILSNNKLSLQIALEMDKTQIAVQNSARRRSDTLLNVRLMPLYESYGYFLEDIKNE